MTCPNCGGKAIEIGISWGQTMQTGNFGLKYRVFIGSGVTQVYSDLCLDCGEVVRTYIKDTTIRSWYKKPGEVGTK